MASHHCPVDHFPITACPPVFPSSHAHAIKMDSHFFFFFFNLLEMWLSLRWSRGEMATSFRGGRHKKGMWCLLLEPPAMTVCVWIFWSSGIQNVGDKKKKKRVEWKVSLCVCLSATQSRLFMQSSPVAPHYTAFLLKLNFKRMFLFVFFSVKSTTNWL